MLHKPPNKSLPSLPISKKRTGIGRKERRANHEGEKLTPLEIIAK